MAITQVEREPLERFARAVGAGAISGPYRAGRLTRPQFTLRISGWRNVQYAIALLWRFLCEPKRRQAARALSEYLAQWEISRYRVCRTHSQVVVRRQGNQCRGCASAAMRRWRHQLTRKGGSTHGS